jgi:hypothetical protein
VWKPVRCAFGVPRWHCTNCHFCATYLLELGCALADVAVQLRHTDGGTLVMSTYGHPSDRAAGADHGGDGRLPGRRATLVPRSRWSLNGTAGRQPRGALRSRCTAEHAFPCNWDWLLGSPDSLFELQSEVALATSDWWPAAGSAVQPIPALRQIC